MTMPEVLVVDDDADVRESLQQGLGFQGLAVRQSADGLAALADITALMPDVVLLDVGMPGMNGVELVRRLRAEGYSLPVCMLSARDEVDDRVAGLAAGADDYVVKPFSVVELAARLHALVRLHRVMHGRPLIVSDLVVEPDRRMASRGGRDLE